MITYRVGDVFDRLAELEDGSVDLIVTSPPFLALRSYLPADHPDKHREIGSEATPAAYLATLLELTAEWRRVLAPHGSLCVELGDTYSGSGGAGGDYNADGLREGQPRFRQRTDGGQHGGDRPGLTYAQVAERPVGNGGPGWPLAKSLTGIPTLYPWCLAYGWNLLDPTSGPSPAGRWRIRNLIVWARPNPPVGALGDKFRPATSYITVACTGQRRWFDLDAVRGPGSPNTHARLAKGVESRPNTTKVPPNGSNRDSLDIIEGAAGAPPLDWLNDAEDGPTGDRLWTMSTEPYAGSHYATFPSELPFRLIAAMCPPKVCRTCGKPTERIVEATYQPHGERRDENKGDRGLNLTGEHAQHFANGRATKVVDTLGWTDCGHDNNWRQGVVLDPFAGSGTVLEVAQGLGRDALGFDLDGRNAELARMRVGMFLDIDE